MKDSSNQVKVKGKDVIEVLSVQLESLHSIHRLYRMESRITVESRHGSEGLSFTDLADDSPVTLYRHAPL